LLEADDASMTSQRKKKKKNEKKKKQVFLGIVPEDKSVNKHVFILFWFFRTKEQKFVLWGIETHLNKHALTQQFDI